MNLDEQRLRELEQVLIEVPYKYAVVVLNKFNQWQNEDKKQDEVPEKKKELKK